MDDKLVAANRFFRKQLPAPVADSFDPDRPGKSLRLDRHGSSNGKWLPRIGFEAAAARQAADATVKLCQ